MAAGDIDNSTADAMGAEPSEPGRRRLRKPGAGRRRDPRIDDAILGAARQVYIDKGYAGFNFDTVSKAAGVSRDAIYRRFSDPDAILHAVLLRDTRALAGVDQTGDAHTVLQDFTLAAYDYFSGGDGTLALRVHVDAHQFPSVYHAYQRDVLDPTLDEMTESVTALFKRAHTDTTAFDVRAIVECLTGAAVMHALLNQAHDGDRGRTERAREGLTVHVDQILAVTRSPS
ncbi:TetR/AcrR family transcriptional regulator [Gordonia terrae]